MFITMIKLCFVVNTKYIQLKDPINIVTIVQCNMQWIKDIV